VLGDLARPRHHTRGHGPAVEQDALVGLLAVVVVPVQAGDRAGGRGRYPVY
jgi:hypothetical protein